MEINLNILTPENIRLITFHENTITVLLIGDTEVTFKFMDREQMGKALSDWAKQPNTPASLSRALQFPPGSTHGQIYPPPLQA